MEDEIDPREQAFHSTVRHYIICWLLFIALYGCSYLIIRKFKKRSDADDLYAGDAEDYLVYRISLWICTFSMAVSIAAVLLLPFSIFGNEIALAYPNSYYFRWLNGTLIHGLWNYVFLLSNVCLFILLPFAYFFLESQGFSGLKKGVMTRVYETATVCFLVIIVILLFAHLIAILLDERKSRDESLFKIWNYQLPFIYSCVSLFGAGMLLACTPVGIAKIFSVLGGLIAKPKLRREIEMELYKTRLEEETLERKLDLANGHSGLGHSGLGHSELSHSELSHSGLSNGFASHSDENSRSNFKEKLLNLREIRIRLEIQNRSSLLWVQNLKYPIAMIVLLALTGVTILLVINNFVQLLIGYRSLPLGKETIELGNQSLSALGRIGAVLETVLIFYLIITSMIGFYSVPGLSRLRPIKKQLSMTKVIANSIVFILLSSALPVLAKTLGLTNFDLLGEYGRIDWLRNLKLVLSYNLLFAIATGLCLMTKFTATMRHELCNRFNEAGLALRRHKVD